MEVMWICIGRLKNYFLQVYRNLYYECSNKRLNRTIKKAIKKQDALYRKLKRRNCTAVARANTTQCKIMPFIYLNKFWKLIKLLNHDSFILPTLQDQGISTDTNIDKANVLNRFFYSCLNNSCLPLTDCPPAFELETDHCPSFLLSTNESFLGLLHTLDTTKSTGCDGIYI